MYEQATLEEESTDTEETCPGGETWCDGPDGDALPCFECYRVRGRDVGGAN
jgi:hypothetical protein